VKLKKCKLPSNDQIPAEGNIVIHKLINSIWIKKVLPDQWKEPIVLPIYKKGDKTDCAVIVQCHCYQLHTTFYPISFSQD
jgi:hypothetical protein